jgi:hypothetical protein
MRDEFAALDLFTPASSKKAKLKKLLGLRRRKVRQSAPKLPLTAAFLPLIAKIKKKPANFSLQGWSIPLSWAAPRPLDANRDEFRAYPLKAR